MHPKNDFRNIENGYNISKENYCDQPYGDERDYGFGRIDPDSKGFFTFPETADGIKLVRFYDRYIRTNDAVANYRYDKENI